MENRKIFNAARFFAATTLFAEEGIEVVHFLCKWENAKENVDAYEMGIRNVFLIEEGLDGLQKRKSELAGICMNALLKLNKRYHKDTGLFFLGHVEDLSSANMVLEEILNAIYAEAEAEK